MSTEHQQYSLQNQASTIREYASEHGFNVVKTYVDAGRSGLVLKHREGLAQLLKDVVGGPQLYRAILVYDVSRWGRFQDTDEAAYYEFLCKRAGMQIHYCTETFLNDASTPSAVMKALKRSMAAEFSRELSDKVFQGMSALVRKGRWVGANPGYGLRRCLLSSEGLWKQQLAKHETKNIKSDQVIVVPGPPHEVKIVREIYEMFVRKRMSTVQIAKELNRRKVKRPQGQWNYHAVLKILTHEKYAGSLVWGRWTQKLRTRCVPVPRERWVVVPGVIRPVVDRQLFDAAQNIIRNRFENKSNEDLVELVRRLLVKKGRLNSRILNLSRSVPCAPCCKKRFGSLHALYRLLKYERKDTALLRRRSSRQITSLYVKVFRELKKCFGRGISAFRVRAGRPKLVKLSSGLKLRLFVCPPEPTATGVKRWRFTCNVAKQPRLVTLLCRCNSNTTGFHDFHVLPDLLRMPRIGSLSPRDRRLRPGKKLRSLLELKEVAHEMAQSNPQAMHLEGWREIAEYLKAGRSTMSKWLHRGIPITHRGRSAVTARREDLDRWRKEYAAEVTRNVAAAQEQRWVKFRRKQETRRHVDRS